MVDESRLWIEVFAAIRHVRPLVQLGRLRVETPRATGTAKGAMRGDRVQPGASNHRYHIGQRTERVEDLGEFGSDSLQKGSVEDSVQVNSSR
jgi:hypothetical protein